MEAVSLKALLTGIGESVKEAQNAIRRNEIQDFFSYFETHSDNKPGYTPQMKNIVIPADVSRLHKDTKIAVPLVAMVHHKNMLMDEVTITLHGKIRESNGEPMILLGTKDEESDVQDEIKLVYRCQEATEEHERVMEAITENIG